MTQEDKNLLLKDLCARLPYKIKILDIPANVVGNLSVISTTDIIEYEPVDEQEDNWSQTLYNIKPYLFPLSSMTEEQKKYIDNRWGINEDFDFEIDPNWGRYVVDLGDVVDYVNWLIENHFDIYGLIPKDLAIDATGLNIY